MCDSMMAVQPEVALTVRITDSYLEARLIAGFLVFILLLLAPVAVSPTALLAL